MTQPPEYPPPGSMTPWPGQTPPPVAAPMPPQASPQQASQPVPRGVLDYPVFYNPILAQQRYAAARRNRTYRIVSLLISAAISAVIWWFWRDQMGGLTWWIIGIGLALPTFFLVRAVIGEFVAKGEASRVHDGLALGVGYEGLFVEGTMTQWSEVGRLHARPGRWGKSPTLVIERRDGASQQVPLDYLSMMPAAVDSGIRALSGGRLWVDFSALDS